MKVSMETPTSCPPNILALIRLYEDNRAEYRDANYKEDSLRKQFLDPLFAALGWDVYNTAGYAEAYKDVVHEDSLRVGGHTKAPDYCFRIGGQRKFFVEAKKPAVNLGNDTAPAFQLRRYGYSAKLPLNLVTNFEEFSIYDCRTKPRQNDKVAVSRIEHFTYAQLPEKWDYLVNTFSPEAIKKGSFDRYARDAKGKRGTGAVDDDFLATIEGWRMELAQYLARHNTGLTERSLNAVVQKTIDRLLFLRIAEDRGIETYGTLFKLAGGKNIYNRLCELFRAADDRYNSGLFHFRKEKERSTEEESWHLRLDLSDSVLKPILQGIYYPESPYEFSVMPVEILGQVYEKFLGNVITLSSTGKTARIEQKPEVRKAGGVYYTPQYIVEYIVEKTLGTLCADKTPAEVAALKVLDPACGSGSFLLGAYQYLLDWHLRYYLANNPQKWSKPGKKTPPALRPHGDSFALTTQEKKRILLSNIHGVDIDAQAVEVTKLSLLLKVLEGENEKTLAPPQKTLALYTERVLPDLAGNIKCGNSLVASDYWQDKQYTQGELALDTQAYTEEDILRINTFDWDDQANGFGTILAQGGFDAVIGNPPYVRQETLGEVFKSYAKNHYTTYAGTADLFVYFIEKGHRLLRPTGLLGYICSNKFIRARYGKPLRDYLAQAVTLRELVDFGELPVFQDAATFPIIIVTQAQATKKGKQNFTYAPIKTLDFPSLPEAVKAAGKKLDQKSIVGDNWTLADKSEIQIFEKMRTHAVPLGEYVNGQIYYGIKTGYNEAFVIDAATRATLIQQDPKSAELIKPFLKGDDVRKYHLQGEPRFLICIPKGWTNARRGENPAEKFFSGTYPSLYKHLKAHDEKLTKRCDKGDYYWEFRACDYYNAFETPKIVYPDIAKESRFFLDRESYYLGNTCYMINLNDPFLLGVLNSKAIWWHYKQSASVLGDADKGGRIRFFSNDLKRTPIPKPTPENKPLRVQLEKQVETMLDLHKRLTAAGEQTQATLKRTLQQQITQTDQSINTLVYELYHLTPEEIARIEQTQK